MVVMSAEPRPAHKQPTMHVSGIVIEEYLAAIKTAGELCRSNLHPRRFVTGNTRVRNGDTPHSRRTKTVRPTYRVNVTGFIADFVGNTRIVHHCERKWGLRSAFRRHNCDR